MSEEKKILGLYPGELDIELIEYINKNEMEEWAIWVYIRNLVEDFALSTFFIPTPDEGYVLTEEGKNFIRAEYQDLDYQIHYLIYQTRKFGVTFKHEPCEENDFEPGDNYKKWFNFWESHFDAMGKEGRRKFDETVREGKDYTEFLPKTRWNDEALERVD